MNSTSATSVPDIVNTRVFSVSRERLFTAFTDPEQLAQWWGPNGFKNTIHTFDLRPGGSWVLTMHGPNGADYHNESEFVEVVSPERIVFVHLRPMHRYQMKMDFAEEAGGTRLTWNMRFDQDEGEELRTFITAANEQNFDRLQALVTRE